ncbi:HipA domain-containing protein [Silvimonas iriomotensis]|uniref:Serine/threonine-protein kinase HipA n=1 Tax=Silvimonas iriomotensis TaxID=449662 RepID=A0ABQ2PAL8_9NEIS|nr:HipA domain-containing protein [Silvimonas iriomotensis]GGP22106.1 serine/threonine-protein kinase HipA [Silvimonas iriomotensis]
MSQEHRLNVFAETTPVGHVSCESTTDRLGFEYALSWREGRTSYPLSPRLALDAGAADSSSLLRYLQNLLPEGRALEAAAYKSKISLANAFALVLMVGEEPAGGVSFLWPTRDPREAQSHARRAVSLEELSERIETRGSQPFTIWDKKIRSSLSGHQDKLQVLVEGSQLFFAEGGLSSTHILKPESQNRYTPCLVANEHYCMTLAARIGLSVAPVMLWRVPQPILLIERFDRQAVWGSGNPQQIAAIHRLHVIDGCQALDAPLSRKYERVDWGDAGNRDGVGFSNLFSLVDNMADPMRGRLTLLRWALFSLFIGNTDAHAKNISFRLLPAGLVPAPMYDLVSVAVYGDQVTSGMAMAYGDEFELASIAPRHLVMFAESAGLPVSLVAEEIKAMARGIQQEAPILAQSEVYSGTEREVVQSIATLACSQSAQLLRMAEEL